MSKRAEFLVSSEGLKATDNPAFPAIDYSVPFERGVERQQARDANTGMPEWIVEVLRPVEEYGVPQTVVCKVQVPSAARPEVAEGPVRFTGLKVTVAIKRQKPNEPSHAAELVEYWSAAGVESAPAPAPASRRSGGES